MTTNFGGVDVVPLLGAILSLGKDQLWGVVPLQGAIVAGAGEGDEGQLWRSGRGAIAGCHCSLLRFGGRVTTNFGEWTGGRCWVPLQGAIVVCYGWRGHFFFTLITQKVVFAIWGLCWYHFSFDPSKIRCNKSFLSSMIA